MYICQSQHMYWSYIKKLNISRFEKFSYFNVYNNTQDKNVRRKKFAHHRVNITLYFIPFPIFLHNPLVHWHRRYNSSRWWSILNFKGNINSQNKHQDYRRFTPFTKSFNKFKRGPSFAVGSANIHFIWILKGVLSSTPQVSMIEACPSSLLFT
jgi:hypothetical protein